ncbi:hypothetical protein ACFLX1_01660 [Chloroflexota bacterium]
MAGFLQSYGIWIFMGLLFLLMVRWRGMRCCGMEHKHNHDDHEAKDMAGESHHDLDAISLWPNAWEVNYGEVRNGKTDYKAACI